MDSSSIISSEKAIKLQASGMHCNEATFLGGTGCRKVQVEQSGRDLQEKKAANEKSI